MIPKIIHYCWFGRNPLPESAKECIASWKKFLPDYEIKEWNEDNFDVNITTYTAEAYKAKKYAFVSDYARFWILYNYGGLYFDTDVEILKPIDDIVAKGGFMGMEKTEGNTFDKFDSNTVLIAAGLGLGVEKGHTLYKEVLDIYNKKHFITWSGNFTGTVVTTTTNLILSKTTIIKDKINEFQGIYIYPDEYFDPMNFYTGEITITPNTRSIHKYATTWNMGNSKSLWKIIIRKLSFIKVRISVMIKGKA
jgi:mannosyltransferase OCH1-like enzyme